ncbi:hypothetical protein EJC47_11120 [Sphingomonas sp. TF3]|uniref:hypothetical protein n=1 Tax=Sphingomonas sp. TF3 TaxID=2495580 RepID=UPI000F85F92C|nr:hypothetical protein [Sphingomonas sp. TF3]RUN76514.1 hypothetical protein EJC47_11120 [Sphingomonas sp. TF3]
MQDIDKARAVRDIILAEEDRVERTSVDIDGAEYPCWEIRGEGWRALVSNLWDLHTAACRARGESQNERQNVIGHELLEVYQGDSLVVNFAYEIGGSDEHLFEFVGGAWESAFDLSGHCSTTRLSAAA